MDRRRLLTVAVLAFAAPTLAWASGAPPKKKGGGASYVQLATVTATIVRPNGRRGVMTLEAGVDSPDEKVRAVAQASLPRLRAAYAQSLQSYAAGLPSDTVPDVEYLSKTLQRDTDRVVGRPGARVLLGAVIVN